MLHAPPVRHPSTGLVGDADCGDELFALLFWTFGSPVYAGLVLMNVPFSPVGGIPFLSMRGINLSVSSAVGFISLFGVAVMSGVLVVALLGMVPAARATGIGSDVQRPLATVVVGGLLSTLLLTLLALPSLYIWVSGAAGKPPAREDA